MVGIGNRAFGTQEYVRQGWIRMCWLKKSADGNV